MKKILAIGLPIITIVGIIIAYIRRFIDKISFNVDLELKLVAVTEDFVVMPLIVSVDNKNKKGITVRDLTVKIYDSENNLIAETYTVINRYRIEGFKNNKFTHDFIIYTTSNIVKIIMGAIEGKVTKVYVVSSFIIFGIIPISKRQKIEI